MATSRPPAPIANMPSEPAAQVWLSDPRRVLPGTPKRCIWTGWLTPLPGLLYHSPKRWHALRRNKWSSALRKSACNKLWSTYCSRQLGADAVEAHRFQLEHHHGAGRVLRQRLIDSDADLAARHQVAFDEVRRDQLLREVSIHGDSSEVPAVRYCGTATMRGAAPSFARAHS